VTVSVIGSAVGTSPQSITVGAAGVPTGAQIIVFASDAGSSTTAPTVADTATNTYTKEVALSNNGITADGQGVVLRARTGTALVNGNTITYTSPVGSSAVSVIAAYITGLQNAAASSGGLSASGSGTAATTGAATPGAANDISVGCVTSNTTQASLVLPAGWNLLSTAQLTTPALIAGWKPNAPTGTVTFAATLGTTGPWAAMVAHFPAFLLGDMSARGMMS
jgi:hypothetical protein